MLFRSVFNNSDTPRAPTQFNSIVANSLLGANGLRNGGGSYPTVVTSHNFFFNNVLTNASIVSQQNGTENYYSQNYQTGGTISTAGAESFFNSADVSGKLQIRDEYGRSALVPSASTADGAPVVIASDYSLGNGTNDDEWKLIPTTSGYYQVVNVNSSLSMAVQNASTTSGAPIVQSTFSNGTGNDEWLLQHTDVGRYMLINRHSDLALDVPRPSGKPITQLDQASPNPCADQPFKLFEDAPQSALVPKEPFFSEKIGGTCQ